ncbi:MAG: hypothetical protein ABIL00_04100 [candidate division WOR-3 bacterium]
MSVIREERICPYYRNCGGCDYQDIDYKEQLARKMRMIREFFPGQEVRIFPSSPFHYRNRMDFAFFPGGIGFRRKGRWDKFVDVEYCLIAKERINQLLREVREFFRDADPFDVRNHTGTFRYAVIRSVFTSSISFVINQDSKEKERARKMVEDFASFTSAENILIVEVPPNTDVSIGDKYRLIKGTDLLLTKINGKEFYFHSQGFFQVNDELIPRLHQYVAEILERYETKYAHLLDLYGGVGVFGIMNRERFRSVIVIDNHPGSLNLVERNCALNKIEQIQPVLLEDREIRKLSLEKPLFVIADPPRAGIHPKALRYLNGMKPELLIYVSCHFKQLVKDLEKLTNFQIKSLAFFDFFPQTKNMELVVELKGS